MFESNYSYYSRNYSSIRSEPLSNLCVNIHVQLSNGALTSAPKFPSFRVRAMKVLVKLCVCAFSPGTAILDPNPMNWYGGNLKPDGETLNQSLSIDKLHKKKYLHFHRESSNEPLQCS